MNALVCMAAMGLSFLLVGCAEDQRLALPVENDGTTAVI